MAQEACFSMSNSRFSCYNKWQTGEPTTSLSQCLCSAPVLSQEFTCSFLANISCAQVPAHFDRMCGWTFCDNLQDVITVPSSLVSMHTRDQSHSLSLSLGDGTTTRWTYYTPTASSTTALSSITYQQPSETAPAGNTGATSNAHVKLVLISTVLMTVVLPFTGWTS